MNQKLEILRQIVREKQAAKITEEYNGKKRKILVDGYTAAAIINLYDAIQSQEQKDKYIALPLARMASIAFHFAR